MDEKVIARFWSKVDKRGPEECWLWTSSVDGKSYGTLFCGQRSGAPLKAHRVSWQIHNGPIPEGLFVLHRCDVPRCVAPHHLFLGTAADNTADMFAKGRGRPGRLPGEAHHQAKLTGVEVLLIRAELRSGVARLDLAERFGVTVQSIRNIETRKNWKHL